MKRSVLFFFICVSVLVVDFFHPKSALAEVNQEELQQYLSNIYWTEEELNDYLHFYDYTLEEFNSLEEIQDFLGTPINNDNLYDLLGKYNMQHNDLEILLAEYGETLDNYKFIEDLDLEVQFYLDEHDKLKIMNDFLSLFGLTEDEVQNLLSHFTEIEDQEIKQKIAQIRTAIQSESHLRGVDEITEDEQRSLFTIWSEMFNASSIEASLYLVEGEEEHQVEWNDIITNHLDGKNVLMLLHNRDGDLLASLMFSEEMMLE